MKRNCSGAYTILEVILSMALLMIISALSVPVYQTFKFKNELVVTSSLFASAIRVSQLYSAGGNEDSQWGTHIESGKITVFKGTVFSSRDQEYDYTYEIPSSVIISGTNEYIFTKLYGFPQATGSTTLTYSASSKTITVNEKGTVLY